MLKRNHGCISSLVMLRCSRQSGLSVIELLVGVAVGLFIMLGAVTIFSSFIDNNRHISIETRVNQELRAAADVVARDLRRAGYWGDSTGGVVTTNAKPVATASVYSAASPVGTAASDAVSYSYSQGSEDNILTPSTENFGFRLSSGTLRALQGGSYQDLTDRGTVIVNDFTVTPVERCVVLQQYCTGGTSASCGACAVNATTGCPSATCATCPFLKLRRFDIALQGTAVADSKVVRNLEASVRVRNDQLLGTCP